MSFPPEIPNRLKRYIDVEVVDDDTVKWKDKRTGAVLNTVTRSEVESAEEELIPTPGEGQ